MSSTADLLAAARRVLRDSEGDVGDETTDDARQPAEAALAPTVVVTSEPADAGPISRIPRLSRSPARVHGRPYSRKGRISRSRGQHVRGYTKDTTGLWYCLECRELYVGPIPGGYQRAEPGRAISADSDGSHPWRDTWRVTNPHRRCWTCGRLPDFRFHDGSPGYRCSHDPVWP